MEVLATVDEVVGHEQHLGGDEPVIREGVVPAAHQPGLPGGGDRLQGDDVGRAAVEPEGGDAGGDRTGGHDDDVVTGGPERGDVGGELLHRRLVDDPALVGHRRRPDLDDNDGRHVTLEIRS